MRPAYATNHFCFMRIITVSTISLAFLFVGCASLGDPLTQKMMQNDGFSVTDLQMAEVRLSRSITLQRDIDADGGFQVADAAVIANVNGRRVSSLDIPAKTVGRILPDVRVGNAIAVSFAENDNNSYLLFAPDPSNGNRYTLLRFDSSQVAQKQIGGTSPPAYPVPAGATPVMFKNRQFYLKKGGELPYLVVRNWKARG